MKNKTIATMLIFVIGLFTFVSCASDGTHYNLVGIPQENQVFANEKDVKEGKNYYPKVNAKTGYPDAAILDVSKVGGVFKEVIKQRFGEVDRIVVTERQYIKEGVEESRLIIPFPTKINEQTGEPELDSPSMVGQLAGAVGAAFPGSAPFVGLSVYLIGLLSKKRSRQHLVDMSKAIIPYDGVVDAKAAYSSAKKAIGLEHSNEDPEILLKVVEKKKAEIMAKKAMAEAKNGGAAALAAEYDKKKVA